MKTEHERKLDKIKKCLRLAKSSNEHEAAAALRQARKMMDEIGLSADEVAASEAAETRVRSQAAQLPPIWEKQLAVAVAEAIGCQLYFSPGFDGFTKSKPGQYVFVGCDGAEAVAQYAFVVLHRQLKTARMEYTRTHVSRCKRSNRIERADAFCSGWVTAVRLKVGALTVPPERKTAIDAFMGRLELAADPSKKPEGDAINGRYSDFSSGARRGREVDLRKPMAGGSPGPEAIR